MTMYYEEKRSATLNYEEGISPDALIDKPKKQTKKKRDGCSTAIIVIFCVLFFGIPSGVAAVVTAVVAIPVIFSPPVKDYSIAVQIENGSLIETNLHMWGGVNRKNELLIDYDSRDMAEFVGLYLDDYVDIRGVEKKTARDQLDSVEAWVISDTDNPYYDGKMHYMSESPRNYVTTETVYDSIDESHTKDTFYNSSGKVVWEFEGKEKGNDLFQSVRTSYNYAPGATSYGTRRYINVNKFLIEKYGLEVEVTRDKSNQVLVFKVPKVAEPLP